MNWLVASSLMFVSSVVLYLLVRKSSLLKVPSQFQNLAMFFIPFLVYLVTSITTRTDLNLSLYQAAIIIGMSFLFSYLGNVFSLKSIELAPNPGYSLVLSKSYVVFTSLAAVPLFHAALTTKSLIAILLIIIFSALVMVSKKSEKKEGGSPFWLPLAFGAFFCWGMLSLTSKYLLILGVPVLSRLLYSMGIVSVLIASEMKVRCIPLKNLNLHQSGMLLLIGVFAAAFNFFMQEGINTAPNIGFINAINAGSIAAVTVCSAIIYKDELTLQKLVGVIGVIGGLILLVL